MAAKSFTVAELAAHLGAEFSGDGNKSIIGVAPLDQARDNQLSFLSNPKYRQQLSTTRAGCVLLSDPALVTGLLLTGQILTGQTSAIIIRDPYLGFAKIAQLLDSTPVPRPQIHPSAVIGENVTLGHLVAIAAGCVVEDDCVLADGVILGANTVVGQASRIGKGTRTFANVSIYHSVCIGEFCLIHSGAVIGADGFGFANEKGRWVKIPQTGGVRIGDRVEIGANACVDRGALSDTVIKDGVKLDNLCHIAHNVELGENVAMAAYSGVAGSSKLGDSCTLSGRTTVLGHLNLAPATHVTACSLISRSIDQAGVYSSGTGMQENKQWRKSVARFNQLDEMAKKLKQLEKQLEALNSKKMS